MTFAKVREQALKERTPTAVMSTFFPATAPGTPSRQSLTSVCVLHALLVACAFSCTHAVDPCPEGMRASRSADRCVSSDRGDGDPTPDAASGDAEEGIPLEASIPDADTAPSSDAGSDVDGGPYHDANVLTPDASMPDAGLEDAGTDASEPGVCTPDDHAAWDDFHVSGELVETIRACIAADPSCLLGTCPLDRCLRDSTGVVACEACVEAEVRCVASHCMSECGKNDDRCRACACHHGCIDLFSSCAGEALDVCSDCNATTCLNMSVLPPELIMVVVSPLLH